jgi:hypothetical protein
MIELPLSSTMFRPTESTVHKVKTKIIPLTVAAVGCNEC